MISFQACFFLLLGIPLVANAKWLNRIESSRRDHLDTELALKGLGELHDEEGEQDFISRQTDSENYTLIIKNDAPLIARLDVLYVTADGQPVEVTTGQVLLGQNKSITLPPNSQSIKYDVQIDIFSNNWKTIKTGGLSAATSCFRVTGITLFPKVKLCKP